MDIVIHPPLEEHRSAWNDLWDGYLTFYQADVSPSDSDVLWNRIQDPHSEINCHVAVDQDRVIGLVHFFPHADTWNSRSVCYLKDLYVEEGRRGQGVGEMLIQSVVDAAGRNGWSGVYWLTAEDNAPARRLYDRLAGGPSGFIVYALAATASETTDNSAEGA